MIFSLLDTKVFPCPRTHKLHLKKLASGFVQSGANFIELEEVSGLGHLSKNDVVYISNHFSVDPLHRPFKKHLEIKLVDILRKTKCKIIFWNFHTTSNFELWEEFNERAIHLGENMSDEYINEEDVLVQFRKKYNVHKLRYSSPYENVSLNLEKREFDFQFVGSNYQQKFIEHVSKNYNSFVRIAPPIVNEVLRVNSFHNSLINLVFHSSANIKKGIIVERFPEAISLGGIVLHDHPEIEREFGHVDSFYYVNSISDIDNAFKKVSALSESDINELRFLSRRAWLDSDLSYKKQALKIIKYLGL
ncbi:hypothetical protein [Shewanella fidelis]|uniref:Glycosyltransferase family 1 protein n=1 Tax=Shewanella fidelis TaxID=173509 RepID=A0AAW8NR59_9GAMM|nr:hypothetical protein [Shewanella fidelis]MDR8524424.1 hypothetical protein [Shewanella fidelis]MDW4811900.1 hypothetical protein [Shewanella fidelis]MDW4817161.1 hypothetical protein [Shewanella fidelis]MDW4821231.1 hypothetical protein [Shewanella fidelis]MDW4822506.1 hypothetical protein [Shewanella fidelis]